MGNMDKCQFGNVNFSLSYNQDQSLVIVELIRATKLVPGSKSKMANPFAFVSLLPKRHSQQKSQIHRKTLEPTSNETFIFHAAKPIAEITLEIHIFDDDELEKKRPIGQIPLPLKQMNLSEARISIWKNLSLMFACCPRGVASYRARFIGRHWNPISTKSSHFM